MKAYLGLGIALLTAACGTNPLGGGGGGEGGVESVKEAISGCRLKTPIHLSNPDLLAGELNLSVQLSGVPGKFCGMQMTDTLNLRLFEPKINGNKLRNLGFMLMTKSYCGFVHEYLVDNFSVAGQVKTENDSKLYDSSLMITRQPQVGIRALVIGNDLVAIELTATELEFDFTLKKACVTEANLR